VFNLKRLPISYTSTCIQILIQGITMNKRLLSLSLYKDSISVYSFSISSTQEVQLSLRTIVNPTQQTQDMKR
jgi:hypothetical protein